MFAATNVLRGGRTRQLCCGYFFTSTFPIQRFCTPVWSVNTPTASKVLVNGKGRTVILFCRNLKLKNMTNTKTPGTKCAEQIIQDLILNDDVRNIKQTLTEFFYQWVQSKTSYDQQERSMMLFHYRVMMDFLTNAEGIEAERRAV
jgi:hypothetical protein